jgi:hypothetical protein
MTEKNDEMHSEKLSKKRNKTVQEAVLKCFNVTCTRDMVEDFLKELENKDFRLTTITMSKRP